MRVGIDASNLRRGGGVTHLRALIANTDPARDHIDRVIVWGSRATLDGLPDHPWLDRIHEVPLEGSLLSRTRWRHHRLPQLARQACDILFAPGGTCTDKFRPVVTMSRNLLPFEYREMFRYFPTWIFLRSFLLRKSLSKSMRRADGTIFLTEHARKRVLRVAGPLQGQSTIISHGIDQRFFLEPRPQLPMTSYSNEAPFRILYSSIIDLYKHQWEVVEAVARLRNEGFPVSLELVGPKYPPALRRVERATRRNDAASYVQCPGAIPHDELHTRYHAADLFVFASTCENLPNILLEAMAAGLPIACSQRGPMPEVLGDAGIYFEPTSPESIAAALRNLLGNPELREKCAADAYRRAQQHSWERCARETWSFVREVLNTAKHC